MASPAARRAAWLTALLPLVAGCSRTVAAAYPSSAEYAENEVPSLYQADVRTVLAARDDEASRSALTCVLLFAYRSALRDDDLERLKLRAAINQTYRRKDFRRPALPVGGETSDVGPYCTAAKASEDPAIVEIGRRYERKAESELGPAAVRAARAALILEDVVALLERGETNLAYRKLLALKLSGPPPAVAERLPQIESDHLAVLQREAAFEARPEIRLLRRREADLQEVTRRAEANGRIDGRATEELRDVMRLLASAHDDIVGRE